MPKRVPLISGCFLVVVVHSIGFLVLPSFQLYTTRTDDVVSKASSFAAPSVNVDDKTSNIVQKGQSKTIQKKNETAILCAMARDEVKYLEEWVSFHLAIGFDEIVLFDNSDNGTAVQWLENDDDMKDNLDVQERLFIPHFPSRNNRRQLKAYRRCYRFHARPKNHTWIAFLDVDEYLVLKKNHEHVVDFLHDHCPDGSLSLNWLVFGTSNQTHYEAKPLTQRFQYHSGIDPHIKTIVRTSDLHAIESVHWMKLKPGKIRRDTSGNTIVGALQADNAVPNPTFHIDGPVDVAAIHHYKYKSVEEFTAKGCQRGYAFNQKGRCLNHTVDSLPSGHVYDDSAWRLLQKMVPRYRV